MLTNDVGLRIKELRTNRLKMTQEQFAKALGYDRTFLARIESGRQNITLDTLEKICAGLGVSVQEFFNH